ncbi:MAG: hypothetical protein QOE70_3799 [Chthoniobacter sp.]|nr:hypothetical protein [Chthoniobacter sp.]
MQVEMGVSVQVSRGEAEFLETRELRGNFTPERRPVARIEGVAEAGSRGGIEEAPSCIGDRRDGRRAPIAKGEVQAHTKRRVTPGDAHRFVHAVLIDHQAGLGEQAGLVMSLDGFIHGLAAAEVVAGEDESFQFAAGAGKLVALR